MKKILITVLAIANINAFAQKFEGLAPTPPMGWNSWNTFACNINEDLIKTQADIMVASGMRDAGYIYLNLDDCWHAAERDSLGFPQADPERFPSGMKALADYIHSKGLKIGIYSDAGWRTCGGRFGSRGHEYQDAYQYAKWGIDYLKYDWCETDEMKAEECYKTMSAAIRAAGRPMILSICEWGTYEPWLWGSNYGHLWRISGDIYPCFDCEDRHDDGLPTQWSAWGIMKILDMRDNDEMRKHAGPDAWNDFDMLEVGNGMTEAEDRAHFSLWCMLASPLIAGNNLATMSDATKAILTNAEAIAINQDKLGCQAFKWQTFGNLEVYAKPLANGELALCFLNRGDATIKHTIDWSKTENIHDSVSKTDYEFDKIKFKILNIWTGKSMGTTKKATTIEVPSHDVVLMRLSGI